MGTCTCMCRHMHIYVHTLVNMHRHIINTHRITWRKKKRNHAHAPSPHQRSISFREVPCSLWWFVLTYFCGISDKFAYVVKLGHQLLGTMLTIRCLSSDTRQIEHWVSTLWGSTSWKARRVLGELQLLGQKAKQATYYPTQFWLPWIPR